MIDLLGAVALLLWGLRMIKTGVLRAYGAALRQWIAKGAANRVSAALWGFLATLGLQSSTATAVIVAAFTARDILRPKLAQAMMLGANLGTAIVALLLSTDLHWLGPAMVLAGVTLFNLSTSTRKRNTGRALLGLGLMLLALQLLSGVTEPLRQSATMATVLTGLQNAPAFALLISAGLAVLGSSSLAVVVLVMLLAGAGLVGPELALWLVAGANLGGAIPALLAVQAEGLGSTPRHAGQPAGPGHGGAGGAVLAGLSSPPAAGAVARSRQPGRRRPYRLQPGPADPVPAASDPVARLAGIDPARTP
ncbi:MAG: Na/Pi symporter [Paracoccaceae bacterium]